MSVLFLETNVNIIPRRIMYLIISIHIGREPGKIEKSVNGEIFPVRGKIEKSD